MADEAEVTPPTHAELFLRAIDIADELEDKLALLADVLRPRKRLPDDGLSEFAARVRNYLPYNLFVVLRQIHKMQDYLRDAHDSLQENTESEA